MPKLPRRPTRVRSLIIPIPHSTAKISTGVAKDSDASMGTRASAAKDAVGDKMNESKHDAKSTADKEASKH